MIGKKVSHYRILDKLGEGGMGIVYKAEDTKLKRTVALKFLRPELTRDPEAKERFLREAQAASALDHPYIGTIHEIDETEDGQLFIVMACYEGETLKQKIERGPLRMGETIKLAMQVADGLAKAHQQGIIHRDIKPPNVMVTYEGRAKILDFGLAKLQGQTQFTKAGTTLGTVAYMSPEQLNDEVVDHRTDIWSLGVLIYEMVTGRLPFKGDYEQAVVYPILNKEPEPMTGLRTGVPMELERIVDKALTKNSDERYQHIDEMLVDLGSLRKELESGKTKALLMKTKLAGKKRSYLYGGVAILVILLILSKQYFFTERSEGIERVAVLPLDNLMGDPEQEYFVDGMTEALIAKLGQIPGLTVISRTSVMRYKETDKLVPEIARELNVDAVVEGSVFKAADSIRITVQLIGSVPERQLWADTYYGDLRNVLALHSEVAQTIAREIQVTLTPQEEARLTSTRPVNPDAYEAYLLGRHYLNRLLELEPDVMQAIEYFERVLEIDSTYASGYAGLADAYAFLGFANIIAPEDTWPKMRAAAEKALALDEGLSAAHTSLGMVKTFYDWDWAGAEREFKRALDINSSNADAHSWYAIFLSCMERHAEAIAQAERALELDPRDIFVQLRMAWSLGWAKHYDEAIRQTENILDSDRDFALAHYFLSYIYTLQGMFEEAIVPMRTAMALMLEDDLGDEISILGYLYGRLGRKDESRRQLAQLDELSAKGRYISPVSRSLVYIGLDDKDQALVLLEQGYETRAGWMPLLNVDPWYDSLRSDPIFTALLKKMGLE